MLFERQPTLAGAEHRTLWFRKTQDALGSNTDDIR
jgi:hypothetical protein